MKKQACFIIPTIIIKSAFIDGQKLVNETAIGEFKPYNSAHTALAGTALGGLSGAGTGFLAETVANQFRDKKKSTKEKLKTALLSGLAGAGIGGVAGGVLGSNANSKFTDSAYDAYSKEADKVNSFLDDSRRRYPLAAKFVQLDNIIPNEVNDKKLISEGVSEVKLNQMTENPKEEAREELFNNFKRTVRALARDKGNIARDLSRRIDSAPYQEYAELRQVFENAKSGS